jgi:hypothetical protein
MVLNVPLDECIDNTHTKVTREKRKRKGTNKKELQQAIEQSSSKERKPQKQSSKDHKELPLHTCKLLLNQSTSP